MSIPADQESRLEELRPQAMIRETEGLTVVAEQRRAAAAGFESGSVFRLISLGIQSSLEAVGLSAAVSAALAERRIPANLLAGYHHDHVLVPEGREAEALEVLNGLAVDADVLC